MKRARVELSEDRPRTKQEKVEEKDGQVGSSASRCQGYEEDEGRGKAGRVVQMCTLNTEESIPLTDRWFSRQTGTTPASIYNRCEIRLNGWAGRHTSHRTCRDKQTNCIAGSRCLYNSNEEQLPFSSTFSSRCILRKLYSRHDRSRGYVCVVTMTILVFPIPPIPKSLLSQSH